MADLAELKRMIEAALPGAEVEMVDEGGGDHLRAIVTAPQFEGLSRIDQHRLVRAAVKPRFDDGQIHALSISTQPPRLRKRTPAFAIVSSWLIQSSSSRSRLAIAENPVLLFMKGTPDAPRCGFSMRVVGVLEQLGVDYGAIDVLPALQPLREITTELFDWQTFPQLYVNGELVGGCDIIEEMLDSGELGELLDVDQPADMRCPRPSAFSRAARRRARPCSWAEPAEPATPAHSPDSATRSHSDSAC